MFSAIAKGLSIGVLFIASHAHSNDDLEYEIVGALSDYVFAERTYTTFIKGECGKFVSEDEGQRLTALRMNVVMFESSVPEAVVQSVRIQWEKTGEGSMHVEVQNMLAEMMKLYAGTDHSVACGEVLKSIHEQVRDAKRRRSALPKQYRE